MAFCENCGTRLQDGNKFCPNCGTPINSKPVQPASPDREQPDSYNYSMPRQVRQGTHGYSASVAGTGKRKRKWILPVVIGVAALLLIIIILALIGSRSSHPGEEGEEPVETVEPSTTIDESNTNPDADTVLDSRADSTADTGVEDNAEGNGNGRQDVSAAASTVISQIKNIPEYLEVSYAPSLAVLDDFNGDGTADLLAVYHITDSANNNVPSVAYSLWSLGDQPEMIQSTTIYAEVGGNSGAVGILEHGGDVYFGFEYSTPEDTKFHDVSIFSPWPGNEGTPLAGQGIYLERSGEYGNESSGSYIIGQEPASMEEYNAAMDGFKGWIYKLDPMSGPNEDVKTFDDF